MKTKDFYLRALNLLDSSGFPFIVGGAYAFAYYTGIVRHTKDLDIFVTREEAPLVLSAFDRAGYRTQRTHPHWIAKAFSPDGEDYVDIIYGSGNGLTAVDKQWRLFAVDGEVFGRKVKVCPAEEMIWSKSFIQERDRFDGADVAHLLLARSGQLDWTRLLERFRGHEPVLLSHLILFQYIYPTHRDRIPSRIFDDLLASSRNAPEPGEKLCRGTLLSYCQYLVDVNERGYADARLVPRGLMTAEEIERWTKTPK
jgi:hypothetical protein